METPTTRRSFSPISRPLGWNSNWSTSERPLATTRFAAGLRTRWLKNQGLRLRKISKSIPGGDSPDRDEQFRHIAELIEQREAAGEPFFFIDTKAKEHLGQLFRQGRMHCSQPFRAFDHDFPSWAEGVLIPHGIYDSVRNCGHINVGLSRDTSQFAADSLKWYWNRIGKQTYSAATSVLLLCDCGGSNAAAKYLVKDDLQQLATAIGLPIQVAHDPSYCSKYNPIERRFFPHITRACTGMLFDTLQRAVELMRQARTATGLRTTVNVINRSYETGRAATVEMKNQLRQSLIEGDLLPKWNYTLPPVI